MNSTIAINQSTDLLKGNLEGKLGCTKELILSHRLIT